MKLSCCVLNTQHAGLTGICEEVYSLKRQVQAAAIAATNPGSLLSLDNGVKQTNRVKSGWTQTSKTGGNTCL